MNCENARMGRVISGGWPICSRLVGEAVGMPVTEREIQLKGGSTWYIRELRVDIGNKGPKQPVVTRLGQGGRGRSTKASSKQLSFDRDAWGDAEEARHLGCVCCLSAGGVEMWGPHPIASGDVIRFGRVGCNYGQFGTVSYVFLGC